MNRLSETVLFNTYNKYLKWLDQRLDTRNRQFQRWMGKWTIAWYNKVESYAPSELQSRQKHVLALHFAFKAMVNFLGT